MCVSTSTSASRWLLTVVQRLQLPRRSVFRIAAVSTHPFSRWEDQGITQGPYQTLTDGLQDTLRANLICGMHVHVGVDDQDERVAVANQARATYRTCWRSVALRRFGKAAIPGWRLTGQSCSSVASHGRAESLSLVA